MTDDVGDLYPGERVLWTGGPARFPVFNRADILFVPFSLLWGGFAIFWEIRAASFGGPPFFLLVGGVFVLLGLYLIAGRLVVRALALRATHYVITDRRVIVRSAVFGRRRERSAYLKNLPPPVLSSRAGPVGTIKFGESTFLGDLMAEQGHSFSMGRGIAGPPPPVLTEIEGAREVRDLIATAQAAPA